MVRKTQTLADLLMSIVYALLLCIWNQTHGDIAFFAGLRASERLGPPSGVPAWGGARSKSSFQVPPAGPSFSEALPSAAICILLAPPWADGSSAVWSRGTPAAASPRLGPLPPPWVEMGAAWRSPRPHTLHPGSGPLGSH